MRASADLDAERERIRTKLKKQEGRFALPDDGMPAFVPVLSVEAGQASEPAQDVRSAAIELVIGAVTVRVPAGAEARDIEAVLRAVWRSKS